MTAESILAELETLGVVLAARGETLRVNAPAGTLTPQLLSDVRAHKREILALVSLRGWPEESRDYVRRFRCPEARLYPFIGRTVATPRGRGRLLQVFTDRAAVVLDNDPRRASYLLPSEVRPPELEGSAWEPFEAAH